ncbi:MAG: class I SAM-dependent methyltransferase [Acidimicrobiales bacterium]
MAAMPTDRLPQGDEKRTAVRNMFDTIAPRYDMVNRIMTFRMDVGWRKRAMKELRIGPGDIVLDLACGTGGFCVELTRSRPAFRSVSTCRSACCPTLDPTLPYSRATFCSSRSRKRPSRLQSVALPCATSSHCPFFAELERVVAGGRNRPCSTLPRPTMLCCGLDTICFNKIGRTLSSAAAF